MRLAAGATIDVRAVLFDLDGTLVNSNVAVERLWRRWAARHNLDAGAILACSHGRRCIETITMFAPPAADIDREHAWMIRAELAERDGIVPVPGARALLAALPAARIAIVTSSTRDLAETRLALAGLSAPAVMITAEDVARGKPDPEGYHEAARRLGVAPEHCLVVEDAPAGLQAGRASGARVIAVATTLAGAELEAWDWVADLTALRVDRAGADVLRLAAA